MVSGNRGRKSLLAVLSVVSLAILGGAFWVFPGIVAQVLECCLAVYVLIILFGTHCEVRFSPWEDWRASVQVDSLLVWWTDHERFCADVAYWLNQNPQGVQYIFRNRVFGTVWRISPSRVLSARTLGCPG